MVFPHQELVNHQQDASSNQKVDLRRGRQNHQKTDCLRKLQLETVEDSYSWAVGLQQELLTSPDDSSMLLFHVFVTRDELR